jgi:hypothetical protein
MSTIAVWLSKAWLAVAVAAVGVFLPFPAQGSMHGTTEIALDSTPAPSNERLQNAWQREQTIYARLGRFFDQADGRLAKAQELIDKAKGNGKDVSALQAALDAFSAAVKDARPIYEGGKGIVAAHKGFDSSGNVVDAGQALQTVLDMRTKLKDVRDMLVGPGKALRDAVRAFRQANHPSATPSPTASAG